MQILLWMWWTGLTPGLVDAVAVAERVKIQSAAAAVVMVVVALVGEPMSGAMAEHSLDLAEQRG